MEQQSNQIVPFDFKGNQLRTIIENDEVWFVAKDVCDVLGHTNVTQAIKDNVDEDDLSNRYPISDALGRQQLTNCVNESGLYALIFGSRLPKAKEFKKWVTKEVLPQIRQKGYYMTEQTKTALLNEIQAKFDDFKRYHKAKIETLESHILLLEHFSERDSIIRDRKNKVNKEKFNLIMNCALKEISQADACEIFELSERVIKQVYKAVGKSIKSYEILENARKVLKVTEAYHELR